MSFSTILIIYIGVGSIGLLGIILSIISLFNLASTSSAINQLQTEIDKKEKEFDTLKKTITELKTQPAPQDIQQSQQQPSAREKEQEIEIVRNVRSEFVGTGEQSPLKQESFDMKQVSVQLPPGIEPAATDDNGDVLDVVEESKADTAAEQTKKKSLTIPLYSQSGKDADFRTLWKTIIKAFEETDSLHINIDFKNILFLYEKELEYLRKIHQTVEMQNSAISFLNCRPELESILGNDPALCTLIKRE